MDIEQHDQLLAYLRQTGRIDAQETPRMRTLAGGVSNRTVLVERANRESGTTAGGCVNAVGEAWVLKQALKKLRVKVDWFSDPVRIHREALGLRWLEQLAPAGTITPLIFEDTEHHLLAMQAVPEPHENWKTMLLAGRLDTGHIEQFAVLLATIHRRSAESAGNAIAHSLTPSPGTPGEGRGEGSLAAPEENTPHPIPLPEYRERGMHHAAAALSDVFDDRSFFESLRLEPYYAYAAEQVPPAADFLHDLIDATRSRRFALVHGDYSPKNILVRDGKLILLDHEVIHWGDPAFDLGFALTHLLSKAHHLPVQRTDFANAARHFVETYAAAVGPANWDAALQTMTVHHTLGCLLARVAGRSPLEYLDDEERARQQRIVVALMQDVPRTPATMIDRFLTGITNAHD